MSFLARSQQHQTYNAITELDATAYPNQVSPVWPPSKTRIIGFSWAYAATLSVWSCS